MPILRNISELVTCSGMDSQDAGERIRRAAIVWKGGKIVWVGSEDELPTGLDDEIEFDANKNMVVPGLIDCHTHLAFGGWRADEFGQRAMGASYLEIARKGGGIKSTVAQTRAASSDTLVNRCLEFLKEINKLGVTTIECKSGYGLSTADEIKLLNVYDKVRRLQRVRMVSTFLGAHVVPDEFESNPDAYVDLIIEEMLPTISEKGLASFCDVFLEDGAFNLDRSKKILEAAKKLGMRPKLHADQLSDGGGANLAAEVDAISADHLEHTSREGIRAMARAGVVAVSLPIATLYLRQPPLNARDFIEEGARVAVATDFNPGSAPSYHLPLALTLACTMNRMTPEEALKGATLFAAHAIGMSRTIGSIEIGKQADFTLVAADSVDQWFYHFVPTCVTQTYINGDTL
ncbi:MAG: imidazolonepropionase [Rhodothermales bacterium]|nr:imidazolonepropionase [Rhodothermales bacterium]